MHNTYTTSQGDTWDMISYKMYGNEKHVDTLIRANLSYRYIVIFSANETLTIPKIEVVQQSALPPWKRGVV